MKDLQDSKQILSSDLNNLAQILQSANLIKDCKPIYDASIRIYNSDGLNWEYECINLTFNTITEKYSGSVPTNMDSFEIILNLEISGKYINHEEIINPLDKLVFNIDLEGLDENCEDIFSSLHLDRHCYDTSDNFVHPNYHFTFGGNNLEAKGDVFKGILVLSTPRIPHPPLDFILGIDFILQNYYSRDKIQNILDNSEYQEIIERAQYRLWRPYYTSINNKWRDSYANFNCPVEFTYNKIVPYMK
ncbi:hypothetical protein B0A67_13300 [Flavobacterium aquidurense]|uniref:hypothetical protein n=1 Tax=Flavobacterium aquidurense TaxID=362413 RepID=UPI0009139DA1|nr:hypothetical protein [Flavobacterium aquidurense]OXA71233.1 hypothetical protein B0A67_13300 [Flavobacterium aquidurense]SHG69209.1 hypothetical protein SAMN05444481_106210 [Flavobacterium frigidimaris]